MNNVFFTSDHHFGHKFVAHLRGFTELQEHTEMLIERWNSRVSHKDLVYHLGDFSLTTPEATIAIRKRLNGQIYFIKGNHDGVTKNAAVKKCFMTIKEYKEIKIDGQKIVLSHFPFLTWLHSGKGSWCLHGHCHGNLPIMPGKRLDVGVDCHDFYPLQFEEIRILMALKAVDAIDHRDYDRDYNKEQTTFVGDKKC